MFIKFNKTEIKRQSKIFLRDALIVTVSVIVIYFALIAYAGNLLHQGPASSTMMSLDDLYNALSGSYDSTAELPKEDGNVMQILKCITTKMNGGICS